MSFTSLRPPDISIITRLRLLSAASNLRGVRPSWGTLSWGVAVRLAVWAGIALLHLVSVATLFLPLALAGDWEVVWRSLPLDDAWIHLVYARSFSHHFVFYFNPGVQEAGATSLLWPMLVGLFHWMLNPVFDYWRLPEAEALVATARGLGLGLGIATSLVALKLVARITGRRSLGIVAAAVIALDPTYTFAKISGVEPALFGCLALAAATAFYCNRITLTGGLLGLAVAARPEGLLLVFLALGALMLRVLWDREDLRLAPGEDIPLALRLAGLPLLVAVGIAAHNAAINGDVYPNSYLVRHVAMGLFDGANLANVLRGYLWHTPYFGGAGLVVMLVLLVLSGAFALRQAAFRAIPLILFPFALYYGMSVMVPLESQPWGIATRRYLDPSLPFIAVALVVGLHSAWGILRRLHRVYTRASPGRRVALGRRPLGLAAALAFLGLAAAPVVTIPSAWVSLTQEFSWSTGNMHYVNVAMAHWIDANLPPGAVIGAIDPGALRYFANRRVVDLTGINTYAAIDKPIFEAARQGGVDYIVARRNIYLDSWPLGREVFSLENPDHTERGTPGMVVYEAMWDREVVLADNSIPHTANIAGLLLLDSVDVGQPISEERHLYRTTPAAEGVERTSRLKTRSGEAIDLRDEGRSTSGSEELVMRSQPGRPIVLVKRYDAGLAGAMNVYAEGVLVGEWRLPPQQYVLGEDTFRIPPDYVTGRATTLRLEHLPQAGGSLTSFQYWVYTTTD